MNNFIIFLKFLLIYFLFLVNFSCISKFVGDFCEHASPCHTAPRCQNGGTCTVRFSNDGAPKFECQCRIGFTESLCEIPQKNACDSSPCQNGGNCTLQSLTDYTCSCTQGYTGMNKILLYFFSTFM